MKRIYLTQDKHALVDDDDYEFLSQWKWCYHNGYAVRTQVETGRTILMHREILNVPKNKVTDHINRIRLDNRKSNIRICTQRDNLRNRVKSINKSSRYKGVYYKKAESVWMTRLGNGGDIYIGQFKNERHAALAYDLWAKDIFGEFSKLNFQPAC